jgi:hypothetical protein
MSRTRFVWGFCLFLAAGSVTAADPPQLTEEIWEAVHVEGVKVGFLHTTVRPIDADGAKRLRTTAELELTFKRQGAVVKLRQEQGTEETPDGKVLAVSLRQGQDKGPQLVLSGALEDERMHIKIDNGRIDRRLAWNDNVVGLYRREHLFQDRKPKPDDHFSFVRYEPTLNTLVTVQVVVREQEEVSVAEGKKSLLRIEMTPDKIEVPGHAIQLPTEVWWLDNDFVAQRRQVELDGLGTMILTRTAREAATAAGPAKMIDIGLKTLVPLNKTIARPHETRTAVYRITLKNDPEPGTAFASDAHQEVKNLKGNTFELHVHPVRPTAKKSDADPPAAEFLESCHFINSDDARVKEFAQKAAGDEKDTWKKAQRLEKWVKQNMRVDNTVSLAPAGQVARELRGDCRQYALLTAALCRAENIPARTAIGLLYVEKMGRPQLGFHMWTEVWVEGQWLGLDGTLGLGRVGATHVKIADHSWHDTQSLTPLLPVNRVLGKVTIEVVSTESAE